MKNKKIVAKIDDKSIESSGPLSADVMSALKSAEVGEKIETPADKHKRWLQSRSGKITGSNFGKLMKLPRNKADKEAGHLAETGKTYLKDVISEILGAENRDLNLFQFEWGKKYEPIAIDYFEEKEGVQVEFRDDEQKCFNLNKHIGATPDGLVSQDYGIEVKCPENATHHLTHILIKDQEDLKKQKPDYYWQCVGGMLVTGLKKWKFISYYHYYDEKFRMKIIDIELIPEEIQFLTEQLQKGKKYLDQVLNEIGYVNIH